MQMQLISENQQYRMSRLQVYNWGTFSGLHDIPIAEKGFLFVGGSGAGKTTILDAFSVLLIPPRWIELNAAASETERRKYDRSLISYIRGAWADQEAEDTGLITKQYLRPGSTWTALALTYSSSSGHTVTVAQLLWVKGSLNANSDVNRHYFIFERGFELTEFESFGLNNMNLRNTKQNIPDGFAQGEYPLYRERFCRLLGIENENALKLLHKTQSAKSLGDLNTFLREYMLDKPETFVVADTLVNEFGELDTAHRAVIRAREQIETLTPARENFENMEEMKERYTGLEQLLAASGSYCELRRIELLKHEIESLNIAIEGLNGKINGLEASLDSAKNIKEELEREHRNIGGDDITRWESEIKSLETQREEHLRKKRQASDACRGLGWTISETAEDFAILTGRARREIDESESRINESRKKWEELTTKKHDEEKELQETTDEIKSLESQPSSIPAKYLEIRRQIASSLGIAAGEFPFIGELIQVKANEAQWQGAIERVLHGFALSVLVDEVNYAAFTEYINKTHLAQRLVYYRAGNSNDNKQISGTKDSIISKLDIKQCRWTDWLRGQLAGRFDYACVQSAAELRAADKAITKEGLVKHNAARHEKDDRYKVGDRRNYVLGFDNQEKLSLYKEHAKTIQSAISETNERIKQLTDRENSSRNRAMHCKTLVDLQWQEIDVVPVMEKIGDLSRMIKEKREGNTALQDIAVRIEKQNSTIKDIDDNLTDAKADCKSETRKMEDAKNQLDRLENDKSITELTVQQKLGLDERFKSQNREVKLSNLTDIARKVENALNAELRKLQSSIDNCAGIITDRFAEFIRRWPSDTGDLDASLSSVPEFLEKLRKLETDGLPGFEDRFFDLLKNQSYQNLTSLSSYLSNERKTIRERMEMVNDSLKQVPFNKTENIETYLSIEDNDRQLPEVMEFKQEIKRVLSYAWNEEDRVAAENRFNQLRNIVERFKSQDSADVNWKNTVLDVRRHIEFIGRERDENGNDIEVYRSGSGKSGGQRQKLTTTCLAAALRYQLGGNTYGIPMYAPVILDEAFDKADNEFTALAMGIFNNFGFQMIVATPLKSVMTLEPFIGGACFVDIKDRKTSSVLLIEYDKDSRRLILPATEMISSSEERNEASL